MTDQTDRYFVQVKDFLLVVDAAWKICAVLADTQVQTNRHSYASIVNDKLVAHAISMSRIVPRRESTPGLVWDLSSVAALSRCIMDAYHTLAYLALDDVTEDEREFRFQLLSLHDSSRRLKMAQIMESNLEVATQLEAQLTKVQEELRECRFFAALPEKQQQNLIKEPPDLYRSREERNKASGINDAFYRSALMYLSQFVHTHGLAIHQLSMFAANTSDSYRKMKIPITFSTVFIARAILGMIKIFNVSNNHLSMEEQATIEEYAGMANGYGVA